MSKELMPESYSDAYTEECKDQGVIHTFNPYLISLLPFAAKPITTNGQANYKQLAETVKKLEAQQAKIKTDWQEEKGNLEAEIVHLRQQVEENLGVLRETVLKEDIKDLTNEYKERLEKLQKGDEQQAQDLEHLADKFEQLMQIVKCQEELFESEISALKKQNSELVYLLSNKHKEQGGDNSPIDMMGVDDEYFMVEPGAVEES